MRARITKIERFRNSRVLGRASVTLYPLFSRMRCQTYYIALGTYYWIDTQGNRAPDKLNKRLCQLFDVTEVQ